ncbi:MAG: Ig-like domain-containing protein [Actinomycetia bacterium]|nr:Ig-like domain-containing protein [Actinomycetes bacterium]
MNVYRLMPDHTWQDTGTVVDTRATSTGDALWSNGKLYVASRTAGTTGKIRIYRFSYSATTKKYTKDTGFPVYIGGGGVESVTIDRDSLGRLWITFTRDKAVWVSHTTISDAAWRTPFRIPGYETDGVAADDISALVSLGGKIGVFWSDQQSGKFKFALHVDTDPDTVWTGEVPFQGFNIPDDHMNMKSMLGDDQGRLHIAVKTSLGDNGEPPESPGVILMTRTAAGVWSQVTVATKGDNLTRPQVVLDRAHQELTVLMSDEFGGNIYSKTTPLNNIAFAPGKGDVFMSWPGAALNNVSTSKDPVNATTGIVAIATSNTGNRYYHAEMPIDPVADLDPPSVVSMSPIDGATGVTSTVSPTVTFSEPMDPSTIDASAFTLGGPSGSVAANVTYDAASRVATLDPTASLAAGAPYTATMSTGAKDLSGNALPAPSIWSFSTGGTAGETVSLTPTADAYVSSGASSSNFGTQTSLMVDGSPDVKSYLKFDLSSVAGRTIQSASLSVPVTTSGSVGTQSVRLTVKDTWTEAGITYANRVGLDATVGTFGPTVGATTYAVPLSPSALQPKVGGLLSLAISSSSGDDVIFGSRESAPPTQLVLVLQ